MNVFQHHDRDFENNLYVYPVVSRRSRGISIGVDLTHERCTFRCVYCSELARREGSLVDELELIQSEAISLDSSGLPVCSTSKQTGIPSEKNALKTLSSTAGFCGPKSDSKRPSPCGLKLAKEIDLNRLEWELRTMLRLISDGELLRHPRFCETPPTFRRLNDIALSGSGEPTLSPNFQEVCRLIWRLGEEAKSSEIWSHPKAVLITNATALHLNRVQAGLNELGNMLETWAKLDGGTPERYFAMNRSKIPFQRVLDNLLAEGRRRPMFIQTMFGILEGRPVTSSELKAWMMRIEELIAGGAQVKGIQMYTVARAPKGGVIQPMTDADLATLAKFVGSHLKIPVAWFGESGGMGEG